MQMTGEQVLPVPRERVWEALNDPAIIRECVPGCESLERASDTEFRAVLTATIGPVKAKFNGKLALSDLDPPNAYRITFEGSGGTAGFAKGGAAVALAQDGAGTRLTYTANAKVGGKLAQVGSRLVDGVAGKMAEEFFRRFQEKLAPEGIAPEAAVAAPAPAPVPGFAGPLLKWAALIAALGLAAYILARLA